MDERPLQIALGGWILFKQRFDIMEAETPRSCSQCGEDRIIQDLFWTYRGQTKLYYVDIGAAVPIGHNNTYLFYLAGGDGVTVEADPKYIEDYKNHRDRDINLSLAIVPQRLKAASIEFTRMNNPGLSGIKERPYSGSDQQLDTFRVPCMTINELIEAYASSRQIDLLSVDVEGLDCEILAELDHTKFFPRAVIAENDGGRPVHRDIMIAKGYGVYAYTFVNTIYIKIGEFHNLNLVNALIL